MVEFGFTSLLPSLLAIILALKSKNVYISLFFATVLAYFILNDFAFASSLMGVVELFVSLLSEAWVLKTLAFALLAGSIIALIEASGGIEGFVEFMQKRVALVKDERSALLLSYFLGVLIFVESSITALVSGAVGRSFAPRYKIAQAKLALVCDSTSASISSIIAINGWGALLLGLIASQVEQGVVEANPIELLIEGILFNFYSFSALVVTMLFILYDFRLGAMKHATYKEPTVIRHNLKKASLWFMVLPILVMVASVFVYLYITGDGDILSGSGSSAIFYTMATTLALMLPFYTLSGNMSFGKFARSARDGFVAFVPITTILLLAFAIGEATHKLGAGVYLASLITDSIDPIFIAALIFLISSVISFATGTSWGTFSIMMPIAIPLAISTDASVALAIGAVISGGVFGDHCSPISDTTIISSMAADCEIIEHVQTQLPYALLSGGIALLLFIVVALLL